MTDQLHILVVDDDASMARTLGDILRIKGYVAEVAHNASEALDKLAETRIDCVISDIRMPEVNGVELFRVIKARQPDMPVVLMTAYSADHLVQEGLSEGVLATLDKPLDIGLLLGFLAHLEEQPSVVIVDDDPAFCQSLQGILESRDFRVTMLCDPSTIMDRLAESEGVILLDIKLDPLNGVEVLRAIMDITPRRPVIMVTGYGDEMRSTVDATLKMGASAYLNKPLEVDKLIGLLTRLRHQELGRALG